MQGRPASSRSRHTSAARQRWFPEQLRDVGGVSITPNSLADFRGITLFQTTDATSTGNLWSTDGTAAGTKSLGNIAAVAGGLTVGQNFFFVGDDGTTGAELWVIMNEQPLVPEVNLGSVVAGQSISGKSAYGRH